jgi:UDP-2,3-diacylglucosamine pyrophosphatase LpxH
MDQLEQLHVVSDLHLGGAPGHQIFSQGAALARLVDYLAQAAPDQQVGLVLNGDIVDFLAAEGACHFDPEGAPAKLRAVIADPAFAPVFAALARFTRKPGRLLVLVLGNHDVELALPEVQEVLLGAIVGDDVAARARVRVAMDGTGYACLVGAERVYCVHGNDADSWNLVDQDALRKYIRAVKQGGLREPPTANAGTRLVVDVMNAVKRDYPFVDLLKPETVPVPAVLAALPLQSHASLIDFALVGARLAYDKARAATGFLGADSPPPADGRRALDQLLHAAGAEGRAPAAGAELLAQAEADFASYEDPLDFLVGGDDMLGWGGLVLDRLRGRDPRDNLREALAKYLAKDGTFDWWTEDEVFRAHDAEVGPDVRFTVVGHTHLERRLQRNTGGVYFNSGTWIRLIRIEPEALGATDAFEPVWRALTSPRLTDLDAFPGLVLQRRTVVGIWAEGGKTYGELRHAAAAEDPPGAPPWSPVPRTRFP